MGRIKVWYRGIVAFFEGVWLFVCSIAMFLLILFCAIVLSGVGIDLLTMK